MVTCTWPGRGVVPRKLTKEQTQADRAAPAVDRRRSRSSRSHRRRSDDTPCSRRSRTSSADGRLLALRRDRVTWPGPGRREATCETVAGHPRRSRTHGRRGAPPWRSPASPSAGTRDEALSAALRSLPGPTWPSGRSSCRTRTGPNAVQAGTPPIRVDHLVVAPPWSLAGAGPRAVNRPRRRDHRYSAVDGLRHRSPRHDPPVPEALQSVGIRPANGFSMWAPAPGSWRSPPPCSERAR